MRYGIATILLVLSCLSTIAAQGQPQPSIQEIIRRFAEAESENKVARNNYTFTQEVDLVTLGPANSITGRYHRVSDIVYDDRGERIEKITYFPPPTLTELIITREDLQDLAGIQPFALTTQDLPKYEISYVGKERLDELSTYVFDVRPKQIRKGERYFQGRIWVDDQDLQIVKAAGQAVPEVSGQKFPHFESYRENIDGRYWFPTYVYADDVLEFKGGHSVHMRMIIRYTNYKKFTTDIRVKDADQTQPGEETRPEAAEPQRPILKKPNPKRP
jgi:hypothetical protein